MTTLLEHLQEQSYDPLDPYDVTDGGDWYDLIVSGIGSVRVALHLDDYTNVYLFDGAAFLIWEARLSPGTPDAVILAVIEAAERQLAGRRGGPVTPAQEEAAR